MSQKSLKLNALGDKIVIDVLVGQYLVRQHLLLRQDLSPATNEILQGYIAVYIQRLGQFYIDQSGITADALNVTEVLGVDTSAMNNTNLWLELQKL